MWLGEQITERGLGNGISIRSSPASRPACRARSVAPGTGAHRRDEHHRQPVVHRGAGGAGDLSGGLRRARPAQDPGELRTRQVGNKVYGGQSSHLPLKLNMSGVIPPIFASSIILLPATVVSWFATGDGMRWLNDIAAST